MGVYPVDYWYWPSTYRQIAFPYHGQPGCKEQDTGWVDAAIYVPAIDETLPSDPNDVKLRFRIETDGAGNNTYAEIENLVVLCGSDAPPPPIVQSAFDGLASSFVAPAPELPATFWNVKLPDQDTVSGSSATHEVDVFSEAADEGHPSLEATTPIQLNAQAPCRGCCVTPLTPIPADDPDSAAMEAGYSAAAWRHKLTDDLQTAEACFKDAVQGAGGTYRLTSTYRTWWYQQHLREVWDKYVALENNNTPECASLKAEVTAEKRTKHGLVFRPAGTDPRHVRGEAIDVRWKPADTGLAEATFLTLADGCNLWRRVPRDKVHLEVKPTP